LKLLIVLARTRMWHHHFASGTTCTTSIVIVPRMCVVLQPKKMLI